MFENLILILLELMWSLGYPGLFLLMFLAGFCAPIPWEVILMPVGASEMDPIISSLMGGLGSSLGAALGYWVGKGMGKPLLLRYVRYIPIGEYDLRKVEVWIERWGNVATIVCRSVQYLPYKTFNLAAGILGLSFPSYMALTLIGSTIKCLSLIYIGVIVSVNYNLLTLTILSSLIVGLLVYFRVMRGLERRTIRTG